jgi:hypothetical protein
LGDDNPTITLSRIVSKIQTGMNKYVSTDCVLRLLKSFHYYLKSITVILERNCPETLFSRKAYALKFFEIQSRFSQRNICFVDEVGFSVSMQRKSGYSLVVFTPNVVVTNIRTRNISVCVAMTVCGLKEF